MLLPKAMTKQRNEKFHKKTKISKNKSKGDGEM